MSSPLTPIPNASLRPDAGLGKPPLFSDLPSPAQASPIDPLPPTGKLPAWPAAATLPACLPIPSEAATPAVENLRVTLPQALPANREREFTDADLSEAISPLLGYSAAGPQITQEMAIGQYLEPLLRATVRRALAEASLAPRGLPSPGLFKRLGYHFKALFSSRSYEEILAGTCSRFRVGEVFLLDAATLALVSFASGDPATHAKPSHVESAVEQLVSQLRDPAGNFRPSFELPDQRHVISCPGEFVILMAVVKGRSSDLVIADLEFALHRIEGRFRKQFQQHDYPLLHVLQPFLEDCLLIQAPACAA